MRLCRVFIIIVEYTNGLITSRKKNHLMVILIISAELDFVTEGHFSSRFMHCHLKHDVVHIHY